MPQKRSPNPFPRALLASGEPNQWLAKYKAAREMKWSLGADRSIWELSDLGSYLLSLGRVEEALEVVSIPGTQIPVNEWTGWQGGSSIVSCRCKHLKCLWELGRQTEAAEWANWLRECPAHHPFTAPHVRGLVERHIAESWEWLRDIRSGVIKGPLARLSKITALRYAVDYIAYGKAELPGTEWFPLDEMEALYTDALKLLRESIEKAK